MYSDRSGRRKRISGRSRHERAEGSHWVCGLGKEDWPSTGYGSGSVELLYEARYCRGQFLKHVPTTFWSDVYILSGCQLLFVILSICPQRRQQRDATPRDFDI